MLWRLPVGGVAVILLGVCGGWFGGGAGVAVEGGGESVDGVVLEAAADVGVGAGGDVDVGVAEDVLDGLDVDAGFEQQGGAGVPEVVEADAADSGLVAQALEFSVDAGGFQGFTGGAGEDEVGVGPVGVGDLAVVGLLGAAGE